MSKPSQPLVSYLTNRPPVKPKRRSRLSLQAGELEMLLEIVKVYAEFAEWDLKQTERKQKKLSVCFLYRTRVEVSKSLLKKIERLAGRKP